MIALPGTKCFVCLVAISAEHFTAYGAFYDCASFNQDISCWNVSSVTGMASVFCRCRSLNQDLSKWDVSNVNDMSYMFYGCESFNKDISSWDVSKVGYNKLMFTNCPIKEEYKPKFK